MQVRLLVGTRYQGRRLAADALLDVPPEVAERWQERGIAEAEEPAGMEPNTPIPSDFPGVARFRRAGIARLEQVIAMSDEQLLAVPGIGAGTLREIRERLG